MIRYAPDPKLPQNDAYTKAIWTSIGGDEMNVMIALSKIGHTDCAFISSFGDDPGSDLALRCGREKGLNMDGVSIIKDETMGSYECIPELKAVYYRRKHSAFALHDPKIFDWSKHLQGAQFLVNTGITPMLGVPALTSWKNSIEAAFAADIPVSIDFNHRPQLGTLATLWGHMKPYASKFYVLILALSNVTGLVELLDLPIDLSPPLPHTDKRIEQALVLLQKKLGVPRLALCLKTRTADNEQTRWSLLATANGLLSTRDTPTIHTPKDDLGGGSAWHAGFLDYAAESKGVSAQAQLRRADLLAALCQESIGDHSQVVRSELSEAENRFVNVPAIVDELQQGPPVKRAKLS